MYCTNICYQDNGFANSKRWAFPTRCGRYFNGDTSDDFHARSSDELSLKKGDRVELLERDDEFGDGWFLGRHIANQSTGLYPEVYTRTAPGAVSSSTATPTFISSQKPLSPLVEAIQAAAPQSTANTLASAGTSTTSLPSSVAPSALPIQLLIDESAPASSLDGTESHVSTLEAQLRTTGQEEVLSESPNAINEHIPSLQSPPGASVMNAAATDSSTNYSVEINLHMSYGKGEGIDEKDRVKEESRHPRAEVEIWSPDDVANHLLTKGVEKHHCDIFRDQEISGEVLLGMDQSSLLIDNLNLGSVGQRLRTWQKIKSLQDETSGVERGVKRAIYPRVSDARLQDVKRTRSLPSAVTQISISQTGCRSDGSKRSHR